LFLPADILKSAEGQSDFNLLRYFCSPFLEETVEIVPGKVIISPNVINKPADDVILGGREGGSIRKPPEAR